MMLEQKLPGNQLKPSIPRAIGPRTHSSRANAAPSGFHYVGEVAQIFEGFPTVPLRRTLKGPNGQVLNQFATYKDYYCILSSDKWMCCVYGCINRHPDKPALMSTYRMLLMPGLLNVQHQDSLLNLKLNSMTTCDRTT